MLTCIHDVICNISQMDTDIKFMVSVWYKHLQLQPNTKLVWSHNWEEPTPPPPPSHAIFKAVQPYFDTSGRNIKKNVGVNCPPPLSPTQPESWFKSLTRFHNTYNKSLTISLTSHTKSLICLYLKSGCGTDTIFTIFFLILTRGGGQIIFIISF